MENFKYITLTKEQYETLNATKKAAILTADHIQKEYKKLLKEKLNELALVVNVEGKDFWYNYQISTNDKEMKQLSNTINSLNTKVKELDNELNWYRQKLEEQTKLVTKYEDEKLKFNCLPWYKKILYKINKP